MISKWCAVFFLIVLFTCLKCSADISGAMLFAFCVFISRLLGSSLAIMIFSSDFSFSDFHILDQWHTFHSLGSITSCWFPFLKHPEIFSRQYWKSTYQPRHHPFRNTPCAKSKPIILPGKFYIRFTFSAICRIVWRSSISQAIRHLNKILENMEYHPTRYPQ